MELRIYLSALLTFLICMPGSAFAITKSDFNQQCNLASNSDYAIVFNIDNAVLTETLWATKKGGGAGSDVFIPLWTNDTSVHSNDPAPVIIDSLTQTGGDYQIQLFYTADPDNNKQGSLDYYLYRTDLTPEGWYYVSSGDVDFSDLNSVQLTIGSEDITDFDCYDGGDIPDKPEPPEPVFPETCDVFPTQLQTWTGNSGSDLFDSYGSSSIYFSDSSDTSAPEVGFLQSSIGWGALADGCNLQPCSANESYMVDALDLGDLSDYRLPTEDSYEDLNLTDASETFSASEAFGAVSITRTDITFETGEYWFDSLDINSSSSVVIPSGEKVVIHAKALSVSGGSVLNAASGGALIIYIHDLSLSYTLKGHNYLDITDSPSVYASIYSEKQAALNNSTLYGSLTAKQLTMSSASSVIGDIADGCGLEPPADDYSLILTPETGYALICESQQLDFQVQDGSGNDSDYNGLVHVTADSGTLSDTESGSGTAEDDFSIVDGKLTLYLRKSTSGTVAVDAYLVDHPDDATDSGSYEFVPFAFSADTQKMVAGQTHSAQISVLACDDGSADVVSDYDKQGVPFTYGLVSPVSGVLGDLTLTNSSGAGTPVDFEEGVADIDIVYEESGIAEIELTDTSFDCSGITGCPIGGTGVLKGSFEIHVRPWTFAICDADSSEMDGNANGGSGYKAAGETFTLIVKPIVYTDNGAADAATRCSADVTTNFFRDDATDATVYLRGSLDTPSAGSIGSGSALIYSNSSGTITGPGEVKSHDDYSGSTLDPWYEFSSLYWNEVGSLLISADIEDVTDSDTNEYLGMTIDTGTRNVGRFYPHHFSIIEDSDTLWEYADGHNGFAYMDQEIGHDFIVQAESSRTDTDDNAIITTNYGRFADTYKATITYKATVNIPDTDGNDDWQNIEQTRVMPSEPEWGPSDWGESSGQIDVVQEDFALLKDGATLDGPFTETNSEFGLLSDKVDGVDFESLDFDSELTGVMTGKLFSESPDFRYGRMVLTDVGGNEGYQISVPLKVEYWDGEQFVTNGEDDGSLLNSTEYCSKLIWSEAGDADNVSLSGAASDTEVSVGQYGGLYAVQSVSGREQFKVWLRQGVTETSDTDASCSSTYVDQPWLQYYWNGSDEPEEDPSATVTFGIFRGNDRVIYRGENRFIGQ